VNPADANSEQKVLNRFGDIHGSYSYANAAESAGPGTSFGGGSSARHQHDISTNQYAITPSVRRQTSPVRHRKGGHDE
jgi:hypothetical protein